MKLSEMTTDQMLGALANITPDIGRITQDKELMAIFSAKKRDDESSLEFGLNRIISIVPQICVKHKQSIYRILSELTGKSIDEIAAQKGVQTIREIKEALRDPELMGFFT